MRIVIVMLVTFSIASCGKFNKYVRSSGGLGSSSQMPDDHDGDNHDEQKKTEDTEDTTNNGNNNTGNGNNGDGQIPPAAAIYTIAAGAGRANNPLNTAATAIVVRNREKVRFVNNGTDDFVLHCDGAGPMPHWREDDQGNYPRLKPGATRDYTVDTVYDFATSPAKCYRHTGNQGILFYLKVLP